MAIGSGIDADNISAISGPQQDFIEGTDDYIGPGTADYVLLDFEDLAGCFAQLTVTLCNADINIEKTVYEGHDTGASCPGSELISVSAGTNITYCFEITNTGDDVLSFVEFDDPDLGYNLVGDDTDGNAPTSPLTLISGSWPLDPAESVYYYYETTAMFPGMVDVFVNTASITADGPLTDPVTSSDQAAIEDSGVECGPCMITGPGTSCPYETGLVFSVSADNCEETSYTWSTNNGAQITGGQGTSTITVTAPEDCMAASFLVSVDIYCEEDCTPLTTPVTCNKDVLVNAPDLDDPVCPDDDVWSACLDQNTLDGHATTWAGEFASSASGGCDPEISYTVNGGGTLTPAQLEAAILSAMSSASCSMTDVDVVVECTVTDICEGPLVCSSTFTVTAIPPIDPLTCPSEDEISACSTQPAINNAIAAWENNFSGSASGGCSATISYTVNGGGALTPAQLEAALIAAVSGTACSDVDVPVVVVCTASDACGQEEVCNTTFTVTAIPSLNPITCPADQGPIDGCTDEATIQGMGFAWAAQFPGQLGAPVASGGCPPYAYSYTVNGNPVVISLCRLTLLLH